MSIETRTPIFDAALSAEERRPPRPSCGVAPRIVVAAGGFRSGSTLQYNLVGRYVEEAGIGRRLGWVGPDTADEVVESWMLAGEGVGVAKCHHVVAGFHNFGGRDEAWAALVERWDVRVLGTVRRTADVERSMCRKFELDPATLHESAVWRENELNRARWRELGSWEQSYDELTRRPVRALRALTEVLDLPWSRRAALAAAWSNRRRSVVRHQRRLRAGTSDPVTLVHWNHIDARPLPGCSSPRAGAAVARTT